jgi:hypothetical protein
MTYQEKIEAAQAKSRLVINNQLAYARSVIQDPYIPWETKEFLLQAEGLSWIVKIVLGEMYEVD